LSVSCVKGALELFRSRDEKIHEAHAAVYEGNDDVPKYKASTFLDETFIPALLSETFDPSKYFEITDDFTIESYHRVYCLYFVDNFVTIVFLDFSNETVYAINPSHTPESLPVETELLLQSLIAKFDALADVFNYRNFKNWSVKLYKHTYIEIAQPQAMEGNRIYVLAVLYFLVTNVPIYLTTLTIQKIRQKFCYWLHDRKLPL
jgi:hypothetical protein